VLYGECLGGALYWHDFLTLARACGFTDPRLVEDRPLEIGDAGCAPGSVRCASTRRPTGSSGIDGLEPDWEDYGQALAYRGTVPHCLEALVLDQDHRFERGRLTRVSGTPTDDRRDPVPAPLRPGRYLGHPLRAVRRRRRRPLHANGGSRRGRRRVLRVGRAHRPARAPFL